MVINDSFYTPLKKKKTKNLILHIFFHILIFKNASLVFFFSPFRAIQIIFGSRPKMSYPFFREG